MTLDRTRPLGEKNAMKRYLPPAIYALAFAAGTITAALAAAQISISQKGREFSPAEISISRGDTVQVLNDDGDLLHHAYIESKRFSFDSGDQQPGSRTNITFPETGDFNVLCAIHPKMKLVVHVK
jgi:plastocyanin